MLPSKRSIEEARDQLTQERKNKKVKMDQKVKETQERLEGAKNGRAYYVKKIKAIEDAINKNLNDFSVEALKDKLLNLQRLMKGYDEKCIEISSIDNEAMDQIEDSKVDDARNEALYSFIFRRIEVLEKKATEEQQQTQVEQTQQAAPQVINNNWGIFDGSQASWPIFKSAFDAGVIANTDIDDKHKYELLRQACKVDEISALISGKNDTIKSAWEKLNHFYGDKYAQVASAIYMMQTAKPISAPSAKTLRQLMNKIIQCIDIIKHANTQGGYHVLFIPNVVSKLDAETKRSWDRHRLTLAMSWSSHENRDMSDHMPDWNDFEKFMEDEIKVYAMQEARSGMTTPEYKPAAVQSDRRNAQSTSRSKKIICNLCGEQHKTYQCEALLRLDFDKRWRAIVQNSLCVKCFEAEHGNTPCMKDSSCNDPCPTCLHAGIYAYHNSTLCPIKFGLPAGTVGWELSH